MEKVRKVNAKSAREQRQALQMTYQVCAILSPMTTGPPLYVSSENVDDHNRANEREHISSRRQ